MTHNPTLDPVIQEAQQAFFFIVGQNFPKIKAGDFPPLAKHNFDVACSIAVQQWLEANQPTGEQA